MSTPKGLVYHINALPIESIAEVGFSNWPTAGYAQILKDSNLDGFSQYFIEMKKENRIIGYAYLQTLKVSFKHFIQLENCCFWEKIVKFLTQGISYHIAYCGSFFKDNICGYKIMESENEVDIFLAIDQFVKVNLKQVNIGLLSIGNVNPQISSDSKLLKFALHNNDYAMQINIEKNWLQFDDYLKAITKKYRARIIKLYKENNFETKSFSAKELLEYKAEIQKLYYNVLTNKTVHVGEINSDYIYNYKLLEPNNFECIGYFNNHVLVGFATYIKMGNALNIHYIGLQEKAFNSNNLYYVITTDALKKAIEEKFEVLQLGRTAFEAKAILGAKPIQINTLYKAKNNLLQRISSYILKKYAKENGMEVSNRNPFKKSS